MKKILFVFLIIILVLTGCTNLEEKKAEKSINKYYKALIDQDYDKAFKELYLYDEDFSEGKTSTSDKEAKKTFQNKIKYLQQENYRVLDYKIDDVEYEDGNSFWHHLTIEVEHNGELNVYKEKAFFHDQKLKISGDDPFIQYRDGKVTK